MDYAEGMGADWSCVCIVCGHLIERKRRKPWHSWCRPRPKQKGRR